MGARSNIFNRSPTNLTILTIVAILHVGLCYPAEDPQMNNGIQSAPANNTTNRLQILPRSSWNANPPTEVHDLKLWPAPFVILHHTYIPGVCTTREACKSAMRSMQRYHQEERKWLDIGYNFAIGGDGAVYEGRGWNREGAHSPKYNDKSIGICFVGDYRTTLPTPKMLSTARALIALGVQSGQIRDDYVLFGHRQVRDTECPGNALFNEISTWPHFRPNPPVDLENIEAYLASAIPAAPAAFDSPPSTK